MDRTESLELLLREALKTAIHRLNIRPEIILKALKDKLGREVSEPMLRNWTAQSKTAWRIPADAIPPLCAILKDDTMQRLLLSDQMREALKLGEWAINSRWILKHVKLEPGKSLARELRKKEITKRLRGARKQ